MFSQSIWNKLNNGKQSLGDIKEAEFQIIKSYSNQLILKNLNHETTLRGVNKWNQGYFVFRCCDKSQEEECESRFKINIDILNKKSTIYFNQLCSHK